MFFRRHEKLRFPSSALHTHNDRLACLNASKQCLRTVCFLPARHHDNIALPDSRLLRRRTALHLCDHQPFRIKLDADCISARHQRAASRGSLAAKRDRQNERSQRSRYFL